jgi:hypothetical protein
VGRVLVTAGVIQAVDVVIVARKGDRLGWVGPLVGMSFHFWAARELSGV